MENVSGIILSGGKSSRMGQDKCELVYNGKTFLFIQIDKMKNVGINDIIVSGYRGTNCSEKVIKDDLMDGPISGIYLGLKNIKNDRAYITSIDTPLIGESIIKDLIKKSYEFNSDVVACRHSDKVEPLVAIYKTSIIDTIKTQIDKVDYKLIDLLNIVNCEYLDIDDSIYETEFLNINYKDDYNKLIAR